MYLDDERLEKDAGEELARRADFEGPLDVVPVSDPNIFSETQRFAQVQAIAQRAAGLPQLYNMRKVEERILKTLKIPNPDELLNPPVEPKEQNAVNENVAATLGRPITAFPEQDHLAHIETHLSYLTSPMLGSSPLMAPTFIPGILQHLKEHIALWYASAVVEITSNALGQDVGKLMKDIGRDTGARREMDRMFVEASVVAAQASGQVLQSLPPIIAQAQQMMSQFQQPPVQDPRIAIEGQKVQLQQAKLQADQQAAAQQAQTDAQQEQAHMQMEQAKLQLDAQQGQQQVQLATAEMQSRIAVEQQRQQAEDQRKAAELQARVAMNQEDNATAMQLAAAEIASGERVSVSTGTGINPNP
jgi:hypothetical protein